MASYRAEIQIGVVGIGQLGTLQKSLNQVSKTVDLLNSKKIEQGFNVQNINTYNAQLQKAWQNINKAAIGSQEEFKAVQDLVAAKRNQVAVQERLNRLIKEQEVAQRKIIATRDAGFGLQGPKLPPGFTSAGKKPAGGGLGFNPAATPESLALGAGFPLLFGGGVGQVAGGLLGSFFGSGFGGQILGSAIGQQLEDALKRITDIGRAAQTLNLDTLRDSVIAVNADLEITVERLIKAGQADAARAEIGRQVALQTGLLPEATEGTARAVGALSTAWNEVVGAVSGLLSLLGRPFVSALAVILQAIAKAAQGMNILIQLMNKYIPGIAIANKLWTEIEKRLPNILEDHEQLRAEIERQTDAYSKQLGRSMKLEEIDKRRNNANTVAAKIQNNELDRQARIEKLRGETADKLTEARLKYKGQDISLLEKQILAEAAIEERTINREAARQRERLEIQLALEALTKTAELEQSRLALSQALNTEELSRLTRQKELALSLNEEFGIINNIATVKQQVAADELKAAYDTAALAVQKAEAEGINVVHTREIAANQIQAAEAKYRDALATADLEARQQRVASYAAEVARQSERAAMAAREQTAAIDNNLRATQAVYQASITINNAAADLLRLKLKQVKSEEERRDILLKLRQIEIRNAELTFRATIAQIKADKERQEIVYNTALGKLKEYEAIVKIAEAQGVANREYYDALEAQRSALRIAEDTIRATNRIASAQEKAASATFRSAVAQADANYQTQLLAAGTQAAASAAGQYAANMQTAATSAARAAGVVRTLENVQAEVRTLGQTSTQVATYTDEEMRKLGIGKYANASTRARAQAEAYAARLNLPTAALAKGGMITRPTIALIGEGRENEFVIPESKAPAFASNFLAQNSPAGAPVDVTVNLQTGPVMQTENGQKYVTLQDLESVLQDFAGSVLGNARSTGGRRFAGVN